MSQSLQSAREIKAGEGSVWKTSLITATFETSSRLTLHANVISVDCQAEGDTSNGDGWINIHIIKTKKAVRCVMKQAQS